MAKDYYFILGVNSDATQDQIKSAYRKEAKRCHPDLSGEGSEPFLAIREAYEVLGDKRRRQIYDEQMARQENRSHPAGETRPEPLRRARCPVEPLIPTRRSGGYRDQFAEFPFRSPLTEPYHRPWSDPASIFRSESTQEPAGIHVRISLTPEEAFRGGRVRVWIPGQSRCPACQGQGGSGFFGCPYCSGTGIVVDEYPVDLTFAGGVVDGASGTVTLDGAGLQDLVLTLHFTVRSW